MTIETFVLCVEAFNAAGYHFVFVVEAYVMTKNETQALGAKVISEDHRHTGDTATVVSKTAGSTLVERSNERI